MILIMYAKNMRWRVRKNINNVPNGIETEEECLWESDYKKNGKLKKNAKKSRWPILIAYNLISHPKILEQIVNEHNLFLSRDNPQEQEEIIKKLIESRTKDIFEICITEQNKKEQDNAECR